MSHNIENERARTDLDRAAAQLDDFTVARLRAVRKQALAAVSKRSFSLLGWLPLSAATAAVVAVLMTTLWWPAPELTGVAAEELEWSLVKDNPDFFTDLDFYDWLRHEQDAG